MFNGIIYNQGKLTEISKNKETSKTKRMKIKETSKENKADGKRVQGPPRGGPDDQQR